MQCCFSSNIEQHGYYLQAPTKAFSLFSKNGFSAKQSFALNPFSQHQKKTVVGVYLLKNERMTIMTKTRLLQILTSLPEDTPVNASFSYGRSYSSEHMSAIVRIYVIENKDKTLTAVLCAQEVKEAKESAA